MARKQNTVPAAERTSAVIYARYSSANQKDVSIEQQVAECQKYAESRGLNVIDIYADRAISGKTTVKRLAFQKMLHDAAKGKFAVVIAWKSSRMGRNMLDAMMNDAKLQEMGVRCVYAEESFDDTAAGRFSLRTMMNVNQFYIENLAEDVRRGMLDNANRCMVNGPIPFGFQKGADKRYELHPINAPIAREIFEKFRDGVSLTEIASELNARGIKTRRGNRWNKGSFHIMLQSEFYIGVYKYADVRIEGGVPAIVSKELFLAVQNKLASKKEVRGKHMGDEEKDYLLTGKLFCGHCGAAMVGMSGTSRDGTKHFYYACQTKRVKKTCHKKNVQKAYIEKRVDDGIRESLSQPGVIEWIVAGYERFLEQAKTESQLTIYEGELKEVKRAISNIMEAIKAGIFTPSTKTELLNLEAEQRRLEEQILAEKALQKAVSAKEVAYTLQKFADGSLRTGKLLKTLIDTFIQAIYVYDDELKIFCNYTADKSANEITVSLADAENVGKGDCECSLELSYGSPKSIDTPFGVSILFFKLSKNPYFYNAGSRFCRNMGG